MEYIEKTLTGIITHGTNSITFTDDFITNESIIDVYFSDDDITPTEQTQDGNRLIVSIESQPQDVSIAVHITNDDTINYADELESLSDTVDEHATAISDLELEFETLDSKVDGLNASNINYDEHSTLYSAMGDIDELETTSKNLVGAINEVKESGGGSQEIYDTTERVIGTWFGKPLYRKSQIVSDTNYFSINTPITFFNKTISNYGYLHLKSFNLIRESDGRIFDLPSKDNTSATSDIYLIQTSSDYRFKLGSDYPNTFKKYSYTIEYTKVGE